MENKHQEGAYGTWRYDDDAIEEAPVLWINRKMYYSSESGLFDVKLLIVLLISLRELNKFDGVLSCEINGSLKKHTQMINKGLGKKKRN